MGAMPLLVDDRQAPVWAERLRGNPLPWLLDDSAPAVRHLALRQLCDLPSHDPAVQIALERAMASDPIAAILAAQNPEGYWVKPGPGYGPKYLGTIWQVIFLDQLGADPADPRVRLACEYVLGQTQTSTGGLGCSGSVKSPPPPSSVIHCLNGNLVRALIAFGWLDDDRVQAAIDWQARSITGEGFERYFKSGTSGPVFQCAANEGLPCAWGAVKALGALARIPGSRRSPEVIRAIAAGVDFLLSVDPATAAYPAGWGNTKPSGSWFKLGFPSGYVADVLQNVEVLCELGHGTDPRLEGAIAWILAQQDDQGRFRNRYAYNGKTWVDFERQGSVSKFVTLRVARVLHRITQEAARNGKEVHA
jgi:hypothetical protein